MTYKEREEKKERKENVYDLIIPPIMVRRCMRIKKPGESLKSFIYRALELQVTYIEGERMKEGERYRPNYDRKNRNQEDEGIVKYEGDPTRGQKRH